MMRLWGGKCVDAEAAIINGANVYYFEKLRLNCRKKSCRWVKKITLGVYVVFYLLFLPLARWFDFNLFILFKFLAFLFCQLLFFLARWICTYSRLSFQSNFDGSTESVLQWKRREKCIKSVKIYCAIKSIHRGEAWTMRHHRYLGHNFS